MPEGVVTQTDNIKVHIVGAQFVVVVEIVLLVARSVGVNDNLCIRALCAHGVATGSEQTEIAVPVVAVLVVWMHLYAAQTVHDFVAHLYQIGGRTGSFERLQYHMCIGADAVGHDLVTCSFPRCWRLNMSCIHPTVRIVEIEHEVRTCRLDTLTQRSNVSQILTDCVIGFLVVRRLLIRVNEDTHAEGVPAAIRYQPRQ